MKKQFKGNSKTIQKILAVALLFTISITGFYACKKDVENHKALETLKYDKRFVGVINDNMTLIQNAKGNEEALKLITKSKVSSLDLERFSIILGFNNFHEYSAFVSNQDKLLLQLKEEYQLENVDQNAIKNIAIQAMSTNEAISARSSIREKVSVVGPSAGGDICESIRVNCLVEVAAIATAAHLACVAADFTVILGAICHGAAVAYQVSAGNTCNLQAQQCNKLPI